MLSNPAVFGPSLGEADETSTSLPVFWNRQVLPKVEDGEATTSDRPEAPITAISDPSYNPGIPSLTPRSDLLYIHVVVRSIYVNEGSKTSLFKFMRRPR